VNYLKEIPRWLVHTVVVLVVLSWIPLAIIARARVTTSTSPRIHVVPDMDNQAKFKAQQRNPLFADQRAMRPAVEGAVARGQLNQDDALHQGKAGDDWLAEIPIPVPMRTMRRGEERFGIYCAPCHGLDGAGNGPVAQRADQLQEGTWVPPSSFHTEQVRQRSDGHIFNTISNGIRKMPAYGAQISVEDRWAIVAHVRALQRSQSTSLDDVPEEQREALR
jgi:mono/diheme cytochrome c family protein